MSKRKKANRAARRKAEQMRKTEAVSTTSIPVPLTASPPNTPPSVEPRKPHKFKKWAVVVFGILAAIAAMVGLVPSFWQAIFAKQQAEVATEQNDRGAGRIEAKVTVLELMPNKEDIAHLLKAADERLIDAQTRKPMEFVFFQDMHILCSHNPRIRVKNTGKEVVDAIKVEVEELSVMPVGPKDLRLMPNPKAQDRSGPLVYRPTIDATMDDEGKLSEKFKPGDEAILPFWKPFIRAIFNAQKVKTNGGQYHGSFVVRVYVRATGTTTFDRAEGNTIPLGITWASQGFTQEQFSRIQDRPLIVKINRPE